MEINYETYKNTELKATTSLLESYCKQLHFGSNLVDNSKRIQGKDNIDFLMELFRLELENRELKRKNMYIRQARFDVFKTFENYSFEGIDIPLTIQPEEIIATSFIEKKQNLILYGKVGAGKTHMAIAAGISACNRGKKVKLYRTVALVNELVDAKKQGTNSSVSQYIRINNSCIKLPILLLFCGKNILAYFGVVFYFFIELTLF